MGLFTLSALGVHRDEFFLLVGLGVSGLGIGLATGPATAAALDGGGDNSAGEAAGLLNTSRMIGLSLGVATMGAIVSSGGNALAGSARAHQMFVAGLSTALRLNAAVAVLAAIVALGTLSSIARPQDADESYQAVRLKRRGDDRSATRMAPKAASR